MLVQKTNFSGEIENDFFLNPNFAPKFFSWVVWSKTNWSYTFSKWISWQFSSNWLFQINVDFDLERAQTSEHCFSLFYWNIINVNHSIFWGQRSHFGIFIVFKVNPFFYSYKLDGVGPVDNRPSTDKLHHFVRKKRKKKKMWHGTCDTWHVTCDMWHMTHDMWHVTSDTWHVWAGEHSLKISAP